MSTDIMNNELKPLLGAPTDSRGENVDANFVTELSQQRSDSMIKWHIIWWLSFAWVATWHCLLSVSALESSMLEYYNLSNSEFALLSSIVFFCAIPSTLTAPYLIEKTNVYILLIIANLTLILAQSLVAIACTDQNRGYLTPFNMFLLYLGRGLTGVTLGFEDVTINSIATLWYSKSPWVSTSFIILTGTVEIGGLTARWCLPYINSKIINSDEYSDSISITYTVGVGIGIIAAIACVVVYYLDQKFVKQVTNGDKKKLEKANKILQFNRDFRLIKKFSINLWYLMIIIMFCWTIIECWTTQISEPLISKYGVNETEADLVLSFSCILAIFLNPVWSYLTKIFYNQMIYFVLLSIILFGISLNIYIFSSYTNDKMKSIPMWIASIIFMIAYEIFFASAFGLLYAISAIELLSLINSVNAFMYLLFGVIEIQLFGVIADQDHGNYDWSLISMLVCTVPALICCSLYIYRQTK